MILAPTAPPSPNSYLQPRIWIREINNSRCGEWKNSTRWRMGTCFVLLGSPKTHLQWEREVWIDWRVGAEPRVLCCGCARSMPKCMQPEEWDRQKRDQTMPWNEFNWIEMESWTQLLLQAQPQSSCSATPSDDPQKPAALFALHSYTWLLCSLTAIAFQADQNTPFFLFSFTSTTTTTMPLSYFSPSLVSSLQK